MITFTGDKFESTLRVPTMCYSLDRALMDSLGNIGYPLKSTTEVYGAKGVGKTTYCTSLAGMIAARLQRNLVFLDWEGQSKETIEGILTAASFHGSVKYMLNLGKESSEDTLERFVEEIQNEEQNVAIMDSLGAFRPTALLDGKIGDRNIGVVAFEIGQFTNKLTHFSLRWQEPGAIFLTNHQHPKIGSMASGSDTSGGEKKKYLSHIRIDLRRAYIGKSYVNFGESYLLKGKVENNRFGISGRDFYVFIVGGEGIHVGLTAMWDCITQKHAKLSAESIKESTTVSMDGNSYGKFRTIFEKRNDPEFFVPFVNKLRETDTVSNDEDEVEEEPKKKRGKK